jgi:hypothetical protein
MYSLAAALGKMKREDNRIPAGMLPASIQIARRLYPYEDNQQLTRSQYEIIRGQLAPMAYHPPYDPIEARRYIS